MNDTIRREDAIRIMACEMYAESQSQGYEVESVDDFIPEAEAWMAEAPSADKSGEWIDKGGTWYCSECGTEDAYACDERNGKIYDFFCPHCGCAMTKE